jgi:protein TonB
VLKHKAAPIIDEHRVIPVNITIQPPTVRPPVTPPKPRVEPPRTNTVKFPPPVLTDDQHATNPPTIDEAKLAVIGQQNIKGKQDDGLSDLGISDGPPAKAVTESTEPVDMRVVEVMPEPVGGAAAWSKFLQKNVRFPAPAQEAGVGGRVWLSFIVEKDGSISNITVERGAGYGMDEEAVRVLKLAPAWKPGIQNGHPVRVRFNLPFNFQVPTE